MSSAIFLGSGLHTALGVNVADCVAALRGAPPQPGFVSCSMDAGAEAIPYFLLSGLPADEPGARLDEVVFEVIQQALDAAGLSPSQRESLALFVGSSSFEIAGEEYRYRQALNQSSSAIPLAECGMANLAERVRSTLGLRGEDYTFNTACTSSANALWYAGKLIEQDVIEHALILAVEFVNNTTTYGFQGLQLLSPTTMRPFDGERNGLVLGESCAAMVLGKSSGSEGFHLRGGANLCDTYSMSTTREDGSAVVDVLRRALASSRLTPDAIRAIKCHGTATITGDAAEARGMLTTFDQLPPCTSLKPFVGHTLGACGLTELILFCEAVKAGFLPGTEGIAADTDGVGFALNQRPMPVVPGHFMLNYFGFGGNNTSLIVSNMADGVDS
ncbi:MAG: beta-ketoacyl synthase N-terminal-like domain-containing protein [Cellvibrionaceae bacterium]